VSVPLLVKIGPDSTDEEIDAITDLAVRLGLDGLVAVNTTIDRAGVSLPKALAQVPGGISGPPLKARALDVLRRIHARAGDQLTLISVGGIETSDDAWERILAGATLVQAYTGFIYGGPLWPRRINRGLAARVRAAGAREVGEMVGAAAPSGLARAQAGLSGRPG
jgi:dihydroorotate dehydrogenase